MHPHIPRLTASLSNTHFFVLGELQLFKISILKVIDTAEILVLSVSPFVIAFMVQMPGENLIALRLNKVDHVEVRKNRVT